MQSNYPNSMELKKLKRLKFDTNTPKYDRYVSDGDELYAVPDMQKLLKETPKEFIADIYVFTKYNYDFESAIKGLLEIGLIEQTAGEPYTYPFEQIEATLQDIRDCGLFTVIEIMALDEKVSEFWKPDKIETDKV